MSRIDRLNQWLTLAANTGVIAGIAFVAVEISQNTEAMKSQTVQSLQSEFREVFDYPPGYVEAMFKAPEERTEVEKQIRRTFFMRLIRIFENQWYQYSRGFLDEKIFSAYQQHLRFMLANEDYVAMWDSRKELGFFHPEFVVYVDQYISKHGPLTKDQINTE